MIRLIASHDNEMVRCTWRPGKRQVQRTLNVHRTMMMGCIAPGLGALYLASWKEASATHLKGASHYDDGVHCTETTKRVS